MWGNDLKWFLTARIHGVKSGITVGNWRGWVGERLSIRDRLEIGVIRDKGRTIRKRSVIG